jgi:hypothetical protein
MQPVTKAVPVKTDLLLDGCIRGRKPRRFSNSGPCVGWVACVLDHYGRDPPISPASPWGEDPC